MHIANCLLGSSCLYRHALSAFARNLHFCSHIAAVSSRLPNLDPSVGKEHIGTCIFNPTLSALRLQLIPRRRSCGMVLPIYPQSKVSPWFVLLTQARSVGTRARTAFFESHRNWFLHIAKLDPGVGKEHYTHLHFRS
jgi:hypothetical protein